MLLKPVVGARFVADKVTTTNLPMLAPLIPWTRDRFMSKTLRVSSPSDRRRYKGLNNNIFLVIVRFNNNNNFRGGRSALPSAGLLCSGSGIAGKPGIRLAHSSSGLAHSLLPALCRQDTSCA